MREELELMRIMRVPPMGKLVILMGDKRYEKLSDIKDSRLKRRVITAIGELMGFAGGYQALVDADVAPPLTAQTPSGSIQSKAASLKEQQDRFLETLQNTKERLIQSNSSRTMPEASPELMEATHARHAKRGSTPRRLPLGPRVPRRPRGVTTPDRLRPAGLRTSAPQPHSE